MKKLTVKQYADFCGISTQAAHKRIKNPQRFPEIISLEKFARNLFFVVVDTKKATRLQK